MSVAVPTACLSPRACSGAIYDGVPTTWPVNVWPSSDSSRLARPKSVILGDALGIEQNVRRLQIAVDDPGGSGPRRSPGRSPASSPAAGRGGFGAEASRCLRVPPSSSSSEK